MQIYSDVFEENQDIPKKYTCDGQGINPPLRITNVPGETKSLVLIVDDPDAPGGTFTHWLVWNIPGDINKIEEDSVPEGALEGMNDGGDVGYYPPCPPEGSHRYFFRVYALDSFLDIEVGAEINKLEHVIDGHILDQAELIGIFSREKI
jgi:Raf kinase inhibitor-like YbhB/YbcL family protein